MIDIVNTLKVTDPGYPEILRQISSPPKQFHWMGQPLSEWISRPKVAIVGSRRSTLYGQQIARKLAFDLSRAGVVVISGLAFGIDIEAHKGALEAGGVTAAVLATPLNRISPVSHINVARRILEQGTILSEYPSGAPVYLGNFVIRNRIISGLSDIIVIPEAVLKSGSLHTARFALEQGKTVMAVPGNINSPASEGSNNLIKSGAIPVTSADDIFFALNIKPETDRPIRQFNGSRQEAAVIKLIEQGITAQDELALAAKLDSRVLSSALTMLEISGHIRPAGGGNWILA
jgi:DNA processing protein